MRILKIYIFIIIIFSSQVMFSQNNDNLPKLKNLNQIISWLENNLYYKNFDKWDPAPEINSIINDGYGDCKMLAGVTSELLNSINVENKIIVIKKRYWHMFIIFKINDKWQIIDNARLKDGYFNNIDEIKKIYKVNKIKKEFKNYNDFKIWFNTRANAFKFIL
ncbi:MAG: hypothetical protein KAT05_07560 [Spirochaetes bacterium]|nr:hypothetical protein [Spirochaetota bacterium]